MKDSLILSFVNLDEIIDFDNDDEMNNKISYLFNIFEEEIENNRVWKNVIITYSSYKSKDNNKIRDRIALQRKDNNSILGFDYNSDNENIRIINDFYVDDLVDNSLDFYSSILPIKKVLLFDNNVNINNIDSVQGLLCEKFTKKKEYVLKEGL